MIKQLIKIDNKQHFYIACSGGVDSMAIADFYLRGGKNFSLAYFNHGTPQANKMQDLISSWGKNNNVPVVLGFLDSVRNKKESPEEFWRNARYKWLLSLSDPIVTCHHLNDVAETWIFSSLHGNPKLIPVKVGNVLRPFLLNEKKDLIDWCVQHNVQWIEDMSNKDVNFPRNRIRHNILPEALKINPGLFKVLRKKLLGVKYE